MNEFSLLVKSERERGVEETFPLNWTFHFIVHQSKIIGKFFSLVKSSRAYPAWIYLCTECLGVSSMFYFPFSFTSRGSLDMFKALSMRGTDFICIRVHSSVFTGIFSSLLILPKQTLSSIERLNRHREIQFKITQLQELQTNKYFHWESLKTLNYFSHQFQS